MRNTHGFPSGIFSLQMVDVPWMLIEGFEETPLTTGLFNDRWYTSSRPKPFLPTGHYWMFHIFQWIGLREHLQETMVFTTKYRVFL